MILLQHIHMTKLCLFPPLRRRDHIVDIILSFQDCTWATIRYSKGIARGREQDQDLISNLKLSVHGIISNFHVFLSLFQDFMCKSYGILQPIFSGHLSSKHPSLISFNGPRTRCPNTCSLGVKPKLSCTLSRMANNKYGKP